MKTAVSIPDDSTCGPFSLPAQQNRWGSGPTRGSYSARCALFAGIMLLILVAAAWYKGSAQGLSREQRLCSPSSGFVTFTIAKTAIARERFAADLRLPRFGRVAQYVSRISVDRNSVDVWLFPEGVRYFELGNSVLLSKSGSPRLPLSTALGEAWIEAYAYAYQLAPEDECDWLIIRSPQGKELSRERHIIAPGP